MPTYINDSTSVQTTIDGMVFRPSESRSLPRYLNDINNELTLVSDTPYENPVLLDTSLDGTADSTATFTVDILATKILIETDVEVEFYRNSTDNTPPLYIRSGRLYKIDNFRGITTGIIKFTGGDGSVKVTVLSRGFNNETY